MNIISHGLWGVLGFGRKNSNAFWLAFVFGVMPDLISFGAFFLMNALGFTKGSPWYNHPPIEEKIPKYVHILYNISHSLIIFAIIFIIVYLARKKIFWPMLAWWLHILMDIPTHSIHFFATPFLWPISDYRFNGVSWTHPYIFYPNIIFIVMLFIYCFIPRKKPKPSSNKPL